ncbi:MAG: dTDP-glucose 4,6-dehydratase, partial [Pseudomonadota bacterium]|nr:dTDP-glucose 4,6-dehydratase [Pseudomonadota bacterium]
MKNLLEKAILVTGGAGFIGANFVKYFTKTYNNYKIINLDLLTYAANSDYLSELDSNPNYIFIKGDICDKSLVKTIFTDYDVRGVIHFAAESHVDNSILRPETFLQTNIMGTFNLINAAYNHWMSQPMRPKPSYEDCRFHHISTDEVYGTLGKDGLFSEVTPYAPNSPYSASKASSDFIIRAYHHTYGLNVTTSNCSNNYGPGQHSEKLIPTIIEKALSGQSIPIYGDGKNIRDWLYVLDHCKAIDLVFHRGLAGETYNVGGRNEKTNLEVVSAILGLLDKKEPSSSGLSYKEQISFVKDRAGHD